MAAAPLVAQNAGQLLAAQQQDPQRIHRSGDKLESGSDTQWTESRNVRTTRNYN